jgi:hypothetical protein
MVFTGAGGADDISGGASAGCCWGTCAGRGCSGIACCGADGVGADGGGGFVCHMGTMGLRAAGLPIMTKGAFCCPPASLSGVSFSVSSMTMVFGSVKLSDLCIS